MDTNSTFVLSFSQDEIADFSNKGFERFSDIKLDNFNKDFQAIKFLNLSNNNFSVIEPNFIRQFPNICQIDINRNKIEKIQGIEFLPNLKKLIVSNNQIDIIDSVENCSETLERIEASRNTIRAISFKSPMNKLNYIDVSSNQIDKISFGRYVPHLKTLKIDNNLLISINELSDFEELESFSASNNQIVEIPRLQKATLIGIKLTNNKITSLSNLNQPKLAFLDVSGNPISDGGINGQIEINKNMKSLFISSTGVTRCQSLSKFFPRLSTVDLSNTKLSDINDLLAFVHSMKNLKVLDVRFTPLTQDLYSTSDSRDQAYDSIASYNQMFPEKSRERVDFRTRVIKSAVSRLQSLDHIKLAEDESSIIESPPVKLTVDDAEIEEEEEDVGDNDGYNLDENFEDENEEESGVKSSEYAASNSNQNNNSYSNQKNEQSYSYNYSNQNGENQTYSRRSQGYENNYSSKSYTKYSQNYSNNVQSNNDSSAQNPSFNALDGNEILLNNQASSRNSIQNTNLSNDIQNTNFNNDTQNTDFNNIFHNVNLNNNEQNGVPFYSGASNSFNVPGSLDNPPKNYTEQLRNQPEVNAEMINRKYLTAPFADKPLLFKFLTHESSSSDENFILKDTKPKNEEEDEEDDDDDDDDAFNDDTMLTTQIITQALSSKNSKGSSIDKNIDFINRSVQAEIDSIYRDQQRRHNEKMERIKKLKKENKLLEKEIEEFKMKKMQKELARKKEAEMIAKKKNEMEMAKKSKSKSRKSIENTTVSHTHHSNTKTVIQSSQRISNSNTKSTTQSTKSSHHHTRSNVKSPAQTFSESYNSDDQSRQSSTSSTSNSYIVKSQTSISIHNDEVRPKRRPNGANCNYEVDEEFNFLNQNENYKPNNSPQKYPQVIELIDGLLAENKKLSGKISSSIKQPYNSTPSSPNHVIHNLHSKSYRNGTSSQKNIQKVTTDLKISSDSKKQSDEIQKVSHGIRIESNLKKKTVKDSNNDLDLNLDSQNQTKRTEKFSSNLRETFSEKKVKKRSKSIKILSDKVNHMNLPLVTREYAEQKLIQTLKSNSTSLDEESDEMKFLLLWLIKGLPLSSKKVRHDMNDIMMDRTLTICNYNYNLTVKAIDKNRHYFNFFESRKKSHFQLLMLFNFNNEKSSDDFISMSNISDSGLDLDLLFNFEIDQIPQDAEFFKNLNYFFKGMPPNLSVTVCAANLGNTKMLMNVKESPTAKKQDKILSKGFDSICYEKNGLRHYILFDKARVMPIYTLLFSTV